MSINESFPDFNEPGLGDLHAVNVYNTRQLSLLTCTSGWEKDDHVTADIDEEYEFLCAVGGIGLENMYTSLSNEIVELKLDSSPTLENNFGTIGTLIKSDCRFITDLLLVQLDAEKRFIQDYRDGEDQFYMGKWQGNQIGLLVSSWSNRELINDGGDYVITDYQIALACKLDSTAIQEPDRATKTAFLLDHPDFIPEEWSNFGTRLQVYAYENFGSNRKPRQFPSSF